MGKNQRIGNSKRISWQGFIGPHGMNIVVLLELGKLGKNPEVIIPIPDKKKGYVDLQENMSIWNIKQNVLFKMKIKICDIFSTNI